MLSYMSPACRWEKLSTYTKIGFVTYAVTVIGLLEKIGILPKNYLKICKAMADCVPDVIEVRKAM